MGFLKKFIIGLIGAVALFVVVAFLLPREVEVSRQTQINAPPEKVFAYVNDLKKFNEWSPWSQGDPNMKQTYSGPPSGVGQKVAWDSTEFGAGTQEIVASEPNKLVRTALDFGDQGTANAAFSLEPMDGGTRVTWGFKTDLGNNPIGRWMGLMFESWIGSDYEKGLASLKALTERTRLTDQTLMRSQPALAANRSPNLYSRALRLARTSSMPRVRA